MKHHKEIPIKNILLLAEDFYELGARKMTIMGGEPSTYGKNDHNELCEIVKESKKIGYTYIRMDSNGQFEDDMLALDNLKKLDEISFSLDGHMAYYNDWLRGDGAFDRCVKNIKKAIELGYTVDLTTCVHPMLITRNNEDSNLELINMINFADSLHIRSISFHVLFKHGFPMDTWTDNTAITPEQWSKIRDEITDIINTKKYTIHVRIPYHFINKAQFLENSKYYGYCPVKLGERILVHPDGQMRVCSGLISSKYCIAKYDDNSIIWEKSYTNELCDHKLNEDTCCTNQNKNMQLNSDLLPLCFSFKPYQKEFIMERRIKMGGY